MNTKKISFVCMMMFCFSLIGLWFSPVIAASEIAPMYTKEQLEKRLSKTRSNEYEEELELLETLPDKSIISDSSINYNEYYDEIVSSEKFTEDQQSLAQETLDYLAENEIIDFSSKVEVDAGTVYEDDYGNIILQTGEDKLFLSESTFFDVITPEQEVSESDSRSSMKLVSTRYYSSKNVTKFMKIAGATAGTIGMFVPKIGWLMVAVGWYSVFSDTTKTVTIYTMHKRYTYNYCTQAGYGKDYYYRYANSTRTRYLGKYITSYINGAGSTYC